VTVRSGFQPSGQEYAKLVNERAVTLARGKLLQLRDTKAVGWQRHFSQHTRPHVVHVENRGGSGGKDWHWTDALEKAADARNWKRIQVEEARGLELYSPLTEPPLPRSWRAIKG